MAFIPYISELQRLVATTAVLAAAAFTASSAHAADESKGKKVLLLEILHRAPLCRDHREIVPRTRPVVWHGGDGSGRWIGRCAAGPPGR